MKQIKIYREMRGLTQQQFADCIQENRKKSVHLRRGGRQRVAAAKRFGGSVNP